ncbi:hypothetical protein F4778DRAFT_555099 [Xylariomycetidae sp. FL2044]|nr:hypothetical protein F4778DRAFT_555099 [Xylariomycetidae sp. FL2044]
MPEQLRTSHRSQSVSHPLRELMKLFRSGSTTSHAGHGHTRIYYFLMGGVVTQRIGDNILTKYLTYKGLPSRSFLEQDGFIFSQSSLYLLLAFACHHWAVGRHPYQRCSSAAADLYDDIFYILAYGPLHHHTHFLILTRSPIYLIFVFITLSLYLSPHPINSLPFPHGREESNGLNII